MFWDGKLIGESGRFITGATPSVRSTKPRIFSLDTQELPDREHVLAIRVWMAPGQEREPDAGGIHIAPRIGDQASIEASYQLQWLETFKGYVVDVIEPLAFLLLAVLAWIARKVLSTRFALSLASR